MQIRPTRIILLTLCATALGITALALNSQPNGSKTQDQEATHEGPAFEQPLPEHKALTATAGKWTGNLTIIMPDGSKMDYPATETNTAIGPFWTQSTFNCLFMGTPYTGTGSMGYNPKTKRYIGTWVDTMSSYFALMEGEMSSDGKTLVMRWDAPDHSGMIVPHRSESVRTDDSYVSTFYTGENTQTMVISMKRAPATEASSGR